MTRPIKKPIPKATFPAYNKDDGHLPKDVVLKILKRRIFSLLQEDNKMLAERAEQATSVGQLVVLLSWSNYDVPSVIHILLEAVIGRDMTSEEFAGHLIPSRWD